ncbi:homoserine dehydrogenase [Anaerosolibacter sp.]|uniref:homoserine dehydrogenase n=1 Tax=Anaerosolibacter sp. TaxID=1872527 RepID=UPI0039EEF155
MKIGLLGCGTVGTGVYEMIYNQKERIEELYEESVEISKILVKDNMKCRDIEDIDHLITIDPYEILDDSSIHLVVEVIGGVTEAYEYITYALNNGKHVVTANKAVVAKHMKEFLELAEKNRRAFLFEGSVGGGIPLLKPLKQCTLLNEFSEVRGILNGTSNFILTKMMQEDLEFKDALGIAQGLGYAEADPTDDIGGADVARKLAILATITFKNDVNLDEVSYRGIQQITKADIRFIKEMGYSVKLLGKAVVDNRAFSALVEPVLFKNTTQFEKVDNAFNMVSVKGNNLKELRFYGEGAGRKATANAVVCDILDVLSSAYGKDMVHRGRDIEAFGTKLIQGKYYIRITLTSGAEESLVKDAFRRRKVDFHKLKVEKELIMLTEKIGADMAEDIIKELERYNLSCFYCRIEAE